MSNDAKEKPIYETPIVMPLGELAKGSGADCFEGNSAHDRCTVGNGAESFSCSLGADYGTGCIHGNKPASNLCSQGTGVG